MTCRTPSSATGLQESEHAAEQKRCGSVPDKEGESIVCGIHKSLLL
jgi:hypothetical protein